MLAAPQTEQTTDKAGDDRTTDTLAVKAGTALFLFRMNLTTTAAASAAQAAASKLRDNHALRQARANLINGTGP
jgi:hypothetical protein